MFSFFRRRQDLAESVERMLPGDLDVAAEYFSANRHRLRSDDQARLAARIRHLMDARDANQYLSKALAEEAISPTAAFELLEANEAAGYVSGEQYEMHRRHIFDAHRREFVSLLSSDALSRFDYFRLLDSYRAAGYLVEDELRDLEHLLETKLNPEMAARRLFAAARTTVDDEQQEQMLRRYLTEFVDYPDFPKAASLYLSIKIDELWKVLPGIRSARRATIAVNSLNNLLLAYLPHTSDLGLTVPIAQIVSDFRELSGEFKPEPDAERPITPEHINRIVVVVAKNAGVAGGYEEDRNQFFSVGAKGRVRAVRPTRVIVEHKGDGIPYADNWEIAEFQGTRFARLRPGGPNAAWSQEEVGLLHSRRASPIFVHQFREAVKAMSELLEQHRADHPGAWIPNEDVTEVPVPSERDLALPPPD